MYGNGSGGGGGSASGGSASGRWYGQGRYSGWLGADQDMPLVYRHGGKLRSLGARAESEHMSMGIVEKQQGAPTGFTS